MSMVLGGAEKMSPTFSVIIAMVLEMGGVLENVWAIFVVGLLSCLLSC